MEMENKKCSKCRKVCSLSYFVGKNDKITTTCKNCRSVKKVKDSKVKNDQIAYNFVADKRDINLLECVDKEKLNYILANHENFDLGSSFINGKKIDKKGQLTLLVKYYDSLNLSGEIAVSYKQKSYGFGRYYGENKLQLQNISKKIRHTISNEKMIDVDMKNAHPSLLQWYCQTNNIPCEGLSYYIDNRDKCLDDIVKLKNIPKDEVKQDLLAIINGRDKYEGQVDDYPDWYKEFYFNLTEITERVSILEPRLRKTAEKSRQANGKGDYNIGGTTINYMMTDLENKCLMCIYDICMQEKIKVGSLVYDGIMLYKDGLPKDLNKLFRKMEERIAEVLKGCKVEILQKDMNGGYDIDREVMEYKVQSLTHLIQNDPDIDVLFQKYESDYVKKIDIDESVEFVKDLEWEHNRKVLCINSCMGSGKTSSICRWIKANNPKRVIVLSPRISYAKSITHEYNEKIGEDQVPFKCYKDLSKDDVGTYDRIVISMESLHKLHYEHCLNNPFDLIVVDECQANLASHTCTETNGKNFMNNSNSFYSMLRYSDKILFCDAFINAKTIDYLTYFGLPTTLLNYQRPMKKRQATIIQGGKKEYDALLPYIKDDLQANKKLYVCMSSANRCIEWSAELTKLFPHKKIRSYCKGEGKEIKDVRAEWEEYDCILTTTTITVGINFDILHFDRCYMAFSSRAKTNVVDLFQCHYRVRHLKDNEVFVHIMDSGTEGEIIQYREEDILKNLDWFEKHKKECYDQFVLAPEYLKRLLCYNQIECNLSVARLTDVVFAFLKACNYDVEFEKKTTEPEEKTATEVHIPQFHDIPLLSKEDYLVLNVKKSNGFSISIDDNDAISKYDFVNFFSNGQHESWVDNSYDNDFWIVFNSYMKTKMRNIKTEKQIKEQTIDFKTIFNKEYDSNQYAVMTSKQTPKVLRMINILKDLGLDYSQKVGEVVSKDKLDSWCNTVRHQENEMRDVFGIKDKKKKKKGEMTNKDCISLLNSIFKDFGYTQINLKKNRKTVDGKQIICPDSPYIVQDCKEHLTKKGLHPEVGMRIYNSFMIGEQQPMRRLLQRPVTNDDIKCALF